MITHAEQVKALIPGMSPHRDHIVSAVLESAGVFPFGAIEENQDGAGTPRLFTNQMPTGDLVSVEYRNDTKREEQEISNYTLSNRTGMIIVHNGVFPRGYNNIRITYQAGYEKIPNDLLSAIVRMVQYHESLIVLKGFTRESIDDHSVSFDPNIPDSIKKVFNKYKLLNV